MCEFVIIKACKLFMGFHLICFIIYMVESRAYFGK
jgi:hypothetical protein